MSGKPRIIAVIPARGGSKRIPKKNIISFAGKPMIAWTIEAAKACHLIDTVLVSTDCPQIQAVSKEYGASVPFLRADKADHMSPVSEATLTSLYQAEEEWGEFDIVVQLMPNCPLRNSDTINDALTTFINEDRSSQISFFKYGWMNPWWAHKLDIEGAPKPLFEKEIKARSQDLDDLYCPTGSIWISRTSTLKQHRTFYSPDMKAKVLDWIAAIDIDDYEDLKMAALIKKGQQ